MELIYNNIYGPISPDRFDGSWWFITFKDNFTYILDIYIIKYKSDIFKYF